MESIIHVIALVILKIRTDHFKNDLKKNLANIAGK